MFIQHLNSYTKKEFIILNGELGLHISKNQNFSADIAIYNRELIQSALTQTTYTTIPPKIVIEIDTKADFGNIHPNNYFRNYIELG